MNTTHTHPLNAEERIFGRTLQPKEIIRQGDIYNCANGKWQPVAAWDIGNMTRAHPERIYIRPVKKET
jgi:hypothetical protein